MACYITRQNDTRKRRCLRAAKIPITSINAQDGGATGARGERNETTGRLFKKSVLESGLEGYLVLIVQKRPSNTSR